ncbi:MAG: YcxB family protein [Lachnospiraceae bacterium]|nr:YcxB family protein [Lachnospiraceae bacterium]
MFSFDSTGVVHYTVAMAKIFYENRFILTKKLHHQYCKMTYQTMNKRMQILAAVLAVIMYALCAVSFFYLRMPKVCLAFLGFGIYFTMMIFWGYRFSEWINFRKMKDEYGPAITMILHFQQDKISVRVNEKSFAFKYSSISKAYETEDSYILILGKKGMVEHGQVIFKQGFTHDADIDEFKKFINKKAKETIFD